MEFLFRNGSDHDSYEKNPYDCMKDYEKNVNWELKYYETCKANFIEGLNLLAKYIDVLNW